eukprot:711131_1
MATDVNTKLVNKSYPPSPLNKPPPIPPTLLTNVNTHPLNIKKTNPTTHHSNTHIKSSPIIIDSIQKTNPTTHHSNTHIKSSPIIIDSIQKQTNTNNNTHTNNNTNDPTTTPSHTFGNLLLGKLETKTNDTDSPPPFQASTTDNTNDNHINAYKPKSK